MSVVRFGALTAAGLVLAACGGEDKEKAGGPTGPLEKPTRAAGLWEQTTSMNGAPPQVLRLCADPSVESTLPWWGRVAQAGTCNDVMSQKQPDGSYKFQTRCDMGGAGKSAITGVGAGDFSTKYEVKVNMITAGAAQPELNGQRQLVNTFERKGDCPDDWALGDVEVPGGTRMNYDPNQVAREIAKAEEAMRQQEAQERAARAAGLEP
jgi:hypothetical protein